MSQKVLVAGTGISGIAAAKLLLAQGGEVVLYDGNEKLSAEELKKNFDEGAKVSVILGELKKLDLSGVELCVISPGISLEAPFVAVLDEARVPIWSEIELAYHCSQGKLIAITGTNGKTTTTALTGEIMRHFFNSVFVVGNIGDPYTAHARETTEESVTVAEVSSFQLETIMEFHPNVSAITNITPDHLDRHKTMDCYIQVKEGIARNQTEEDSCVLNYDDPELRAFGSTLKSKVIYFSRREKLDQGVYMDGDRIVYRHGGKTEPVLDVKDLQIIGGHNHENVMTAVAISLQMGVPIPVIREACMAFKAVEHRIEFVRERFGVTYYNDSKGTNPDAAIQAIRAQNQDIQKERAVLLGAIGLPEDALDDKPACPLCGDTGWRGAQMCQCLKKLCTQEQIRELSKLLDLGEQSFDSFRLDYYSQTPWPGRGASPRENMELVYEVCLNYAQKFGRFYFKNLFLSGAPGLGKTFLSACIARTVSEEGFSVVYDTAGNIFAQFELKKFQRDAQDAQEAKDETRRYLNCDLLILDDLGSELTTQFTQSALYELVNTRLVAGRCTVISSNLSMDEAARRYSPQIASRLAGEYHVLHFFGDDIRLLKKQRM